MQTYVLDFYHCLYDLTWLLSFTGRPCVNLTAPVDGSMVGNGHLFGDVANFSCNGGFNLSGSDSRQCQADATWSGSITSCNGKMPFMADNAMVHAVYF